MDRKINLTKIAGKASKVPKAVNSPAMKAVAGQSATESPYFSPIAGRTRSNQTDVKVNVTKVKVLSSDIKPSLPSETVGKIEKKLSTSPPSKSSERKHVKIEYDDDNSQRDEELLVDIKKEIKEEVIEDEVPVKQQAKKRSSGGKVKSEDIKVEPNIKTEDSEGSSSDSKQAKWEPKNWQKLLANIREMRKERSAPVDTMGCDKCYDEHVDEKTKRFHHLVALMLSSQTKDAVTYAAMGRLRKHGLTPEKMIEINVTELEQLLYPVGFYKTKAKSIQKTSQILIDKFDSDIPNDIKGLTGLAGVGPKMAHICMRVAWGIVSGIGVDTHVHRIANRLKWVPKETKDPEQTRIALEKWLPFKEWSEVNELLVGFGQTICTPIGPKCDECLNARICPASSLKKKSSYF